MFGILFSSISREKNDFTHFLCQYTYLLTSQLENQRLYFQEKITQIEKDAAEQVST